MLRLDDVLRGVGSGQLAYPVDPTISFASVTNDSRLVREGAIPRAALRRAAGRLAP